MRCMDKLVFFPEPLGFVYNLRTQLELFVISLGSCFGKTVCVSLRLSGLHSGPGTFQNPLRIGLGRHVEVFGLQGGMVSSLVVWESS